LHAHLSTKGLVHLLIAVDGGDLGNASEGLGGRLVGGLEVLAVTAPWRVESGRLSGEDGAVGLEKLTLRSAGDVSYGSMSLLFCCCCCFVVLTEV
jgi:hypothetical protein